MAKNTRFYTECQDLPENDETDFVVISSSEAGGRMLTDTKVEYRCKNGLVLWPGSSNLNTCDHDGQWSSSEAPECVKGMKTVLFFLFKLLMT